MTVYAEQCELLRLKEVVVSLSDVFGWPEEDAVDLVLCDEEPVVHVRASTHPRPHLPGVASAEIVLSIPMWASERNVTDGWRSARKQAFSAFGAAHVGKVSERWVNVAWHVYRRLGADRRPQGGWQAVWCEWNSHCRSMGEPEWQFPSPQQMAANFRRFERNVLGTVSAK